MIDPDLTGVSLFDKDHNRLVQMTAAGFKASGMVEREGYAVTFEAYGKTGDVIKRGSVGGFGNNSVELQMDTTKMLKGQTLWLTYFIMVSGA